MFALIGLSSKKELKKKGFAYYATLLLMSITDFVVFFFKFVWVTSPVCKPRLQTFQQKLFISGQKGYRLPSGSSGPAPGSPSSGTCTENLQSQLPRIYPNQMLKPPQDFHYYFYFFLVFS
ncbi:hypothetical protein GOODEAATRI_010178 [Goodea atripinnis]|uniref:Vomeronasal type-1 receptor n=1 Tax=Goodea atripinnis TaxID=208336 RepID=A0ABV0PXA6_9TELE